jgi:hypothetical protein
MTGPYTEPASDALISRRSIVIALGGTSLSAANMCVGLLDHDNGSRRSMMPRGGLTSSPGLLRARPKMILGDFSGL